MRGDEPWQNLAKKAEKRAVRKKELEAVDKILCEAPWLTIDCETTGLYPYKEDRLFSIAVTTPDDQSFYFNFNPYPNLDPDLLLELKDVRDLSFHRGNKRKWVLHNAKFDIAFLHKAHLYIDGTVQDTMVQERLISNDDLSYSLDSVAKKYGLEKSTAVDDYIDEHGLWEWETIPGKKARKKKKFYHLVPFYLMSTYAMNDSSITNKIFISQLSKLGGISEAYKGKPFSIYNVLEQEAKLTEIVFNMEALGVQIDREYCERKINDNMERARQFGARYTELTGLEFVDSNKRHAQAFEREGVSYSKTEKGNPSFTDKTLTLIGRESGVGRPREISEAILGFRECTKRANTFFSSFIHFSDSSGVVHPNFRQSGTASGRFSCADPNLQQVPKADEDDEDSKEVKRAFIPREGFCFVEMDYKALEYHLMLDYSGEMSLIEKVKSGLDVHEATAQMIGTTRQEAKTLNFAILYGAGSAKIAQMLSISEEKAREFKQNYFNSLPNVSKFINGVINRAKTRGWIFNWMGRRYSFQDGNYAYKAPNYLIQGSGADVCKKAMVEIAEFLEPFNSRMILQVHDSILFEIYQHDLHIVPVLQKIMEDAYPAKHLPMKCSVSHSWKSWGDLTSGPPVIQSKHGEGTRGAI